MSSGLVVVGSGPAGLAAATAYREHCADDDIVIVSADEAAPYNRPPLSKDYLRGEAGEDTLPLQEPSFYPQNRIALRLNCEVTGIDVAGRLLRLAGGAQVPYAALVLATGARPKVLPVPGAADGRVHQLRSLAQARSLRSAAANASRAIVIGSGFIGCEAAASLALRGVDVTLITNEDRPQEARLGDFAGQRIIGWLTAFGVSMITGAEITNITDGRSVQLKGRGAAHAELILVAGGIEAATELAAGAGLAMSAGRIVVDASMRTSAPGILAAGDAVQARNPAAGRALTVEHWGDAAAMGRVAGITAAGERAAWDSVPGFWSEIGDRTLKYAAWGDGFDNTHAVDHGDGAFTVWYSRAGIIVGVLTHDADDDFERGNDLVSGQAPASAVQAS